jgi:acyl carrier protein
MTANAADVARAVVDVIAETFGIDSSCVSRATTAADVDGWDSLAHTVLMVRLEKRLGRPISERIAARADSVGELIDLLCSDMAVQRQGAH